jgi:hypothetical protein
MEKVAHIRSVVFSFDGFHLLARVSDAPRGEVLSWPFDLVEEGDCVTTWLCGVTSRQKGSGWMDIGMRFLLEPSERQPIEKALLSLRHSLDFRPVAGILVQSPFRMAALRRLYELILDTELDRRNFSRQVRLAGFVRPEGEAFRFDAEAFDRWARKKEKKIF